MTIHGNIRGLETYTIIYMVLFICNYEFVAEKLERALSSLIDIIFSGVYHKYEVHVIELLYLSRQSSSTNIMLNNILVMFLCC